MWTPIIATALSACGPSTATLGGDSGEVTTSNTTIPTGYDGPTTMDSIEVPGCNKAGTAWVYQASTAGWTGGHNIVNAWETGALDGWNEEHTLPSDTFGPLNSFDILKLSLAPGATEANFTVDFNTAFECGIHDVQPVMTYAIRVYNLNENYVDCAIFSTHGQEGIDAVLAGRAPAKNPVTRGNEINSKHCKVWDL